MFFSGSLSERVVLGRRDGRFQTIEKVLKYCPCRTRPPAHVGMAILFFPGPKGHKELLLGEGGTFSFLSLS